MVQDVLLINIKQLTRPKISRVELEVYFSVDNPGLVFDEDIEPEGVIKFQSLSITS